MKNLLGSERTFRVRMGFWLHYIQTTLYSGTYDIWGSKHKYCFVFGNAKQWILNHQSNADTALFKYIDIKKHHQQQCAMERWGCIQMPHVPVPQCNRAPREGLPELPVPPVTSLLSFLRPSPLPLRKDVCITELQETVPATSPTLCSLSLLPIFPLCLNPTSAHRQPEDPSHPPWTLTS